MTNEELLQRPIIELEMIKMLLTLNHDEEALNLLLDRLNEVNQIIKQLENDIENDKI